MKKIIGIFIFIFCLAAKTCCADNTPLASFDHNIPHEVSSDNSPILTGTATAAGASITSVECRVDGGSWSAATPADGSFNNSSEGFLWAPSPALARSYISHEVEARAYDSAGRVSSIYGSYAFYVIGLQPLIVIRSNHAKIVNGDSISNQPEFEVTIISNQPPITARRAIREKAQTQDDTASLPLTVDPLNPYFFYGLYQPSLSDGVYQIKVEATDSQKGLQVEEINQLSVNSMHEITVEKPPLAFPNPYNSNLASSLALAYTLNQPANGSVRIFNLVMEQIRKIDFTANGPGGTAGYNELIWDGRDAGGRILGNGTYIFLIEASGRILAAGKVTFIKK